MDVTGTAGSGTTRDRLSDYAALVRLPNVFTAPPDVVAGSALAVAAGASASSRALVGLALASSLLYAAGTTLNDYFDADVDARERPERPIPSGRVPRRNALAFGLVLLSTAVGVAFVSSGVIGGAIAAGVAGLVVLYDGFAKDTAAGFLVMGATRGGNVLLGTAAGDGPAALPTWALAVPVGVAAYVAAVTWMASSETRGGEPTAVGVTAAFAFAVAVLAPVVAYVAGSSWLQLFASVALGLVFLLYVGPSLADAYREPVPELVGPAVGRCVLGLVILEAAFAATAGPVWSAIALAFFLPAVGLAELFDVS